MTNKQSNTYLVCCSNVQADAKCHTSTFHLPYHAHFKIYLPLVDLVFDAPQLEYIVANINHFDFVLIASPSVIAYAKPAILAATVPQFLTVGQVSAATLKQLSKQTVLYPESATGKHALLKDVIEFLDLRGKKVLELTGSTVDVTNIHSNFNVIQQSSWYMQTLRHTRNTQDINWQLLNVYQRVLRKIDIAYLQKLLLSGKLEGIIITSSVLAQWLFSQVAAAPACCKLLKQHVFITTHEQVKDVLCSFGVQQVKLVDNYSDGYEVL